MNEDEKAARELLKKYLTEAAGFKSGAKCHGLVLVEDVPHARGPAYDEGFKLEKELLSMITCGIAMKRVSPDMHIVLTKPMFSRAALVENLTKDERAIMTEVSIGSFEDGMRGTELFKDMRPVVYDVTLRKAPESVKEKGWPKK